MKKLIIQNSIFPRVFHHSSFHEWVIMAIVFHGKVFNNESALMQFRGKYKSSTLLYQCLTVSFSILLLPLYVMLCFIFVWLWALIRRSAEMRIITPTLNSLKTWIPIATPSLKATLKIPQNSSSQWAQSNTELMN